MPALRRAAMPLALLAVAACIPHAQAQGFPDDQSLTLVAQSEQVPWDGTPVNATVVWRYGSQLPLAGNASLSWALACPRGTFEMLPAPPLEVTFEPGAREANGTVQVQVRALPGAPGLTEVACTLAGTLARPTAQASAEAMLVLVASYHADVSVVVPSPTKAAGPQKQMVFPIELTSASNARTTVHIEHRGDLPGRWNLVLPEPVFLDPGQSVTVNAVVSTPYRTGRVEGQQDIVLQVVPKAWIAPSEVGDRVDLVLSAKVQGVYVPGPALPLAAAALGLAAAWRRRSLP